MKRAHAPAAERLPEGPLAELYEWHVGKAVGLARLLTGDQEAAEDVVHEAFLRVTGRFGHLRAPEAFEAYLRRTLVNLCRARFRRLRVERAWLEKQPLIEPLAHQAYDPDDREVVWRALERLPYRQRAAIVLRYYEDLSVERTGEVLRCSTRAANSLLTRAMTTLRKELSKEE